MRTRTTVVYNAQERYVFQEAALARFVGTQGPVDQNDTEPRTIARLAMKGFEHNRLHLLDSLAALQRCRERCVIESDPNYFLLPPLKRPKEKPKVEEGVPLFLDPLGAVKVIIDARKRFIRDIDRAIALVHKGLAVVGESHDDDPDFDPEDDEESQERTIEARGLKS